MPLDFPPIRNLAEGELISVPGFYNISLARHHSQPCVSASVTSGVLRRMELHSPADVWAFHQLNPNRFERTETDALRLGQAMHAFIEGGAAGLAELFMILPEDKPNKPTKAQLQAIKEGRGTPAGMRSASFWAEVARDPRSVLAADELELLVNMGKALQADPAAQAALGGHPELTMAWQDAGTGLWCLARPDQISFSGMLSDFKKVAPAGKPFTRWLCNQQVDYAGYDCQMAFAAEGFQMLTGEWPDQVGLVFQSDTPPYSVILLPIEDDDLMIGKFRNHRALKKFRECLDSGHWPGPGEDILPYHRRDTHRERLLADMAAAGWSL